MSSVVSLGNRARAGPGPGGGATAEAQQTGALSGVVRDAQGGVLPGVTVSVSSPALDGGARTAVTTEGGIYQFADRCRRAPTRWPSSSPASRRSDARRHRRAGRAHHPPRHRTGRRHPAGDHHRERRDAGRRRVVHGHADQHHQGPVRVDPDRAQPVGDGRPGARRGHRPARRRRHRGHAAVQPRGVRLGRQPEVVLDRRPQDQLGRRQRRRHDAVLRLRDVRGIQHADGVGHRGERCLGRLHEHGHQVGRQPLHQRPQLLLHERQLQGDNVDDELRRAPRPRRRASRPAPPATRSTSPTTGARRSAGRSCATSCGSSARRAGGGWTSSRSAPSTPTARRPSTTTASRTTWAR